MAKKFKILMLLIFSSFLLKGCGEDCLYGCDRPTLPSDCSTLTEDEVDTFDELSITYLEDGTPEKSLEILECFQDAGALFTDVRKIRWITATLENYGFDTLTGLIGILSEIANVVDSGSTTATSLPGVPDINTMSQALYFSSVVVPLETVYASIAESSLDANQSASYSTLGTSISIYVLNAHAYPGSGPVVAGLYTDTSTPMSTSRKSFITSNLICGITDPNGENGCPNGSEQDLDDMALALANAFYIP